jgi:hypothetical protein
MAAGLVAPILTPASVATGVEWALEQIRILADKSDLLAEIRTLR